MAVAVNYMGVHCMEDMETLFHSGILSQQISPIDYVESDIESVYL